MDNKYYYVTITNIPKLSEDTFKNTIIDNAYCTGVKLDKTKTETIKKIWYRFNAKEKKETMPIIVEVVDEKEVRDLITSTAYFIDQMEEKKTNFIRVKLEKALKSSEVAKYLKRLTDEEKINYKAQIMKIKYNIAVEYQLDKERRKKEAIEEFEGEEYIKKYKKENWI